MKRVGVVGFSAQKFDKGIASKLISVMFDSIEKQYPDEKEFVCVSGLTDLGIPALAYREADKRNTPFHTQKWKTVGIACNKAQEYDCYKVHEAIIVGQEWGDESKDFIDYIDILLRIGGGNQSKKEEQMARDKKIPVLVFDLPSEGK